MNENNIKPVSDKPAENMGFDKYVAIALLVGLIAGFVIGQSYGSTKSDKKGINATTTDQLVNSELIGDSLYVGNSDLKVEDQKSGYSVKLSNLKIGESYWVAVRDSESETNTPYILGARRVSAGTYTDVNIRLSRATVSGEKYDVVFYKDSVSFNYDTSNIVKNGESAIQATFRVNQ